jgi:hypothetical protein
MVFLSFRGITGSLKTAAILFVVEVAVIVLLSAIVLAQGGAHGLTLEPLSPASSPNGLSGLALGMVFGILSFVGFEAATTLGEEVRNPHRNIPRGMFLPVHDLQRDDRLRYRWRRQARQGRRTVQHPRGNLRTVAGAADRPGRRLEHFRRNHERQQWRRSHPLRDGQGGHAAARARTHPPRPPHAGERDLAAGGRRCRVHLWGRTPGRGR